jgi:hypothetical protein
MSSGSEIEVAAMRTLGLLALAVVVGGMTAGGAEAQGAYRQTPYSQGAYQQAPYSQTAYSQGADSQDAYSPAPYSQSAYSQTTPLTGSVIMNRAAMPESTGTQQQAETPTLESVIQQVLPYAANAYENRIQRQQQYAQYDSGVRQADFETPVYRAQANQWAGQNNAPYVWCQSVDGGYYDSSGTAKEHVMANQLFRYGGRFQDGTPVPAEPITSFNSMGHAYHTSATGGPSFWYR